MNLLSLSFTRGVLWGLLGTGVGIGLTAGIRGALGFPGWEAGPVTFLGALVGVVFYLVGLGAFRDWFKAAIGAPGTEVYPEGEGPGPDGHPHSPDHRPRWARYLSFDTNHKVIGLQYLATSLIFLVIIGLIALLFRLELSGAGQQFLSPHQFNSLMSLHGILALLLVVLPGVAAMINYLVPMMIGARDMAFPRLNALSFWLVPPAGLLMLSSLLAGGFETGWTGYPPLSARTDMGVQFMMLGAYLGGFSSILGAINFIVTILRMRAPGMSLFRMPIFVWTALATALLQLGFTQFIAMSFLMVLFERLLGMGFFDPAKGGSALLFQHLFWFYSHPAVYIFILTGLGVISELVPVFSRKPLFGYKAVALSAVGIALAGSVVWGHHMFTAGMAEPLRYGFMFTTMLVAVPTGVKVFSWLATLWEGKLWLATPMLFVLTAIVVFLIGGLTGLPLALVPVDINLHDTYFVVAHFHYTLFGGFVFPLMAAIYYWFPKVTGRLYREALGKLHWAMMTMGYFVFTLPLFQLGMLGMRRRIADYVPLPGWEALNSVATVGAFLVGAGVVLMLYNLVRSALAGERAPENPWDARTLEWQLPSPPPEENFEVPPQVVNVPYTYGLPGAVHARPAQAGSAEAGGGED